MSAPLASSKDTKTWCRGKVGRAHKLIVRDRHSLGKDYRGAWGKDWLVRYCTVCGREVAWYFPVYVMGIKPQIVPQWVIDHRGSQ